MSADPRPSPPPAVESGLTSARRLRTLDSILDVPAFRWYLLSMLGNWSAMQMQQVVRGYLAYDMTGSYAALGAVALANSVPRLLLALSGGVIADRASRRYVMQAGQAFSALLTAAVAVLLFADLLTVTHLIITAALQGVSMSFTMPARQAMIPEIVGPERLTNAIGLNASGMNTMRLLAPALAGVLLAVVGGAWVYTLMAALYVAAVVAMFRVPTKPVAPPMHDGAPRMEAAPRPVRTGSSRGGLRDIGEAFAYLRHQPVLTMLLVVHLFVVLFSMPYQRLLPGFVADVLANNDAEAAWKFGVLLTFTGLGALMGSLFVASLPNRRRGRLLIASIALFAVALLAFAASVNFWLSIGIVIVLGIGQAGRQSLSQILIQTHVEDAYRGRISSIMMMEMGLESFGTFAIALIAVAFGIQWAFGFVALALLAVAVVVALLLPSYRRLE